MVYLRVRVRCMSARGWRSGSAAGNRAALRDRCGLVAGAARGASAEMSFALTLPGLSRPAAASAARPSRPQHVYPLISSPLGRRGGAPTSPEAGWLSLLLRLWEAHLAGRATLDFRMCA